MHIWVCIIYIYIYMRFFEPFQFQWHVSGGLGVRSCCLTQAFCQTTGGGAISVVFWKLYWGCNPSNSLLSFMMVSSFGVASIKGYYVFIAIIALLNKSMRHNFAASRSTSVFFLSAAQVESHLEQYNLMSTKKMDLVCCLGGLMDAFADDCFLMILPTETLFQKI